MRRGHGGKRLRDLVARLRERVPGLVFRTAFILGHPGETDAEFEELLEFVEWAQFDHVGVFHYSDEPDSHSVTLDDKVSRRVAKQRARKLMSVQRKISRSKNRARVGQHLEVLVEGPSEESELVMVGRHAGQAPEIDGSVFLSGAEVFPGQMRRVRVAKATDYDLLGEVIDEFDEVETPLPPPSPLVHRSSDGRRVALRTL
jgi:ribosomal protein S12 methylthiotransferase